MNIKERKMYIPEQHLQPEQKQNKNKIHTTAKIKFYWTDLFTREELFIVTIHVCTTTKHFPYYIKKT